MKIIVHRGAEETGGNCIELVSGKSRILLDYGALPGAADEETILNIPGLYDDKASHPILGLIISHTHLSHYGALLARPINPGIKVFMTEIMEDVIRINAKMPRDGKKLPANIHYFRKGHKFIVGRFVITPYLMDHTAAESFAFLIESEGKRVIYTGDFRAHGGKANAFKQFLAASMGPVDALITEGVRAGIEKGPDEQEVMDHLEPMVKDQHGAVYFMCAGQDIGLLTSLAALARNTKRYLVVDGYTVLVLERLKELALKQGVELKIPGLDTEYLRIVRNAATQRIYQLTEYAGIFRRMRPVMFGWDWVNDNLRKLIIPVRANSQLWVDEQIKDFGGAAFVYSDWESYGDEPGMRETLEWFKAQRMEAIAIPSSGHAYFSTIRKLVENKRPRYIIPVNAGDPEKFTSTFGKRAKVLKNGEEFALDQAEKSF
ncbi:MAG: MBL fold metallo-hydrolase [Elusimicrobiota bacterium]|nr:MBL fold metallo-hydrolase [Elusimicrobiota bacterium]